MRSAPSLSVVIVNWNSAQFTRKCLQSLYRNAGTLHPEVVVIDNASYDGCEAVVQADFPEVRFIQSQNNLGFSRANNLACNYVNGDLLLFLNPDTEIVGSAIQSMVSCIESVHDAGIVGPRLLNTDLSVQTSAIRSFPSIWNRFVDCEYLRRTFPYSPLWGNRVLFEECSVPVPVEAISGACLMIRRKMFEAIGRFCPEYFMYAEDTDLCYRVWKSGWRNYYVGDAMVIHHGGESSSSQSVNHFSSIMMRESCSKYFRMHHGLVYAKLYRTSMAISALLRWLILLAAGAFAMSPQRRRDLCSSRNKWVGIMRWAVGLERWVKQYHSAYTSSERVESLL